MLRRAFRGAGPLPLAILVLGLIATAAASAYLAALEAEREQAGFERIAASRVDAVTERLAAYRGLLRAGAAFFAAAREVDRRAFAVFAEEIGLERYYPGVQGLGFSLRVPAAEKERVEASLRMQGYDTFAIHPDHPRPEYHTIAFLEPLDRRNAAAIGFDMFSEPVRREAMERARDTGEVALSGRVTLVQEIDEQKQAGFLMYMPVYKGGARPASAPERAAELHGFVYSPFRAGDLFSAIFGAESPFAVDVTIFDGEARPENLLYSPVAGTAVAPRRVVSQTMDHFGRRWTVVVAERSVAGEQGTLVPWFVLGGVAATLLLAGAALAESNARHDAVEAGTALRLSNQTLEERVASEIGRRMETEAVLRQAQKMEVVGQLTGGVAHDFNNLLTVISGNLDILQRRTPEQAPDLRRYADAAQAGAERAATLTQRLLAFARRQPLNPRPLDPNRLVAGMSDLLHRTLGERIVVETVLPGGLWKISADANQLESAILNLAVNARDAMPGGGKLAIETGNSSLDAEAAAREETPPGEYVCIAVSDTGTGMTKEVIERAFDPFFTTKEVGRGTGLGLSQVYGFLKQSGGFVQIDSELGAGTTIRLYLPRFDATDDRSTAQPAPPDVPRGRDTETILVVEDEEDVRTYASEIIRELGYRVLTAADGAQALDLLGRHPETRLLFTDVGLPGGMNGRQLADEAQRRRPDLPVLFTTGYARDAIVHHGRLDPGVELIAKPFTYATLGGKLRAILDRGV